MAPTETEPDEPPADGGYLAPLPRRRLDDDREGEFRASCRNDPGAVVTEMLERANALFQTLDHDVAGLNEDLAEARIRAEAEWKELTREAEAAGTILADMRERAEEIVRRKGRLDQYRLATAMPTPSSDESVSRIADRAEEELRLAAGLTGVNHIESLATVLGQLDAASVELAKEAETRRVALFEEADEELVAERKEASASFEIGEMVLTRDLEVLAEELPASAFATEDPRWRDWQPPTTPTRWITRCRPCRRCSISTPAPDWPFPPTTTRRPRSPSPARCCCDCWPPIPPVACDSS